MNGQAQYYDLQNNFIGIALHDHKHSSLPLISAGIYCSVADRLGLVARPCGFPFHVYVIIDPPIGFNLDGEKLRPGSTAEVMYIDPFRSDQEVLKNDLEAQLTAMGVNPSDRPGLLGASTTMDLVRRTARNIISSIQTNRHVYDTHLSATIVGPDLDGAFYGAIWAMLLLSEDDAATSQRTRYLPYLVDHLEKQYLLDVRLLEDFILPLFEGTQQHQQLCEAVRAMRAGDSMPKQIKPRAQESSRNVRYRVGHVFRHKRYHYLAIITGWDVECEAGELWMSQMGVDNLARGRHQSFYHVLSVTLSIIPYAYHNRANMFQG